MSKVLNRSSSENSIETPQSQLSRAHAVKEGGDLLGSIVASMASSNGGNHLQVSGSGDGDIRKASEGGGGNQTNAPSPAGYFNLVLDPKDESMIISRSNPNWSPAGSSILSAAVRSPCPVTGDSLPSSEQFQKQSEALAFSFQHPPTSRRNSALSPSSTSQLKAIEELPVPSGSVAGAPLQTFPGSFKLAMPNAIARNGRIGGGVGGSSMTLNSAKNEPNTAMLNLFQKGLGLGPGAAVGDGVEILPNIEPEALAEILEKNPKEVLLLDLRSSTTYGRLRIKGSVNVCLPTTLMKRPSFNVSKLAEALPNPREKDRLAMWKDSSFIVVYDAGEPVTAAHTVSKFKREGWTGKAYFLRGGFEPFAEKFPDLIEDLEGSSANSSVGSLSTGGGGGIFGLSCPLPKVKTNNMAFFSNIRQNMELINGVGELPISIPEALTKEAQQQLPAWLRRICSENGSKILSEEFWQIEKDEQKRMQIAWGTAPAPEGESPTTVTHQLAGIERGDKNRYKDIYPYDHTRVKLVEPQKDHGDYINASHLSAHHSAKRYIATQAPLPSTFIDFWSLVWEQDVRVIVMLTAEVEGGTTKCHPYWKDEKYGPLELLFLNETRVSLEHSYSTQDSKRHSGPNLSKSPSAEVNVPHIIVRRFFLKHTSFPFCPGREITQLQYSHWPDFGAPAHPAHILGLVEHTDAVVRACSPSKAVFTQEALANVPQATINIRPILVHCSAGCGRTGAFCTVDSVIGMLRRQRFHKLYGYSRGSDELESDSSSSRASSRASNNRPSSPTSQDNDWLERDDEDLIAEAVHDFRKQRLSMVQSLRQFVLCYETVLEWIARQKPLDSAKRKAP